MIEEHNEHFDFAPVKFQPKPRNGFIPIEVGGTTKPALRRAGRLGDGWIEVGSSSLEEAKQKLDIVHGHRRDAGRENLPFEVTFNGAFGRDLDGVRRCEDVGATRIIVTPMIAEKITPELVADFTKQFADDVIARV